MKGSWASGRSQDASKASKGDSYAKTNMNARGFQQTALVKGPDSQFFDGLKGALAVLGGGSGLAVGRGGGVLTGDAAPPRFGEGCFGDLEREKNPMPASWWPFFFRS